MNEQTIFRVAIDDDLSYVVIIMCSEQWGKIPVGMAGLKNPIGDPLGRGCNKSGGVKMHRV